MRGFNLILPLYDLGTYCLFPLYLDLLSVAGRRYEDGEHTNELINWYVWESRKQTSGSATVHAMVPLGTRFMFSNSV